MVMRFIVLVPAAAGMTCPPSAAWGHHASCQLVTTFTEDCATVQAEMEARIAGEGGWIDPHNKGKYTKISGTGSVLDVQRKTGNGKYTDKMTFTFENADSGCTLSGCSESQVFSVLDFGTNYCNLHDLYAGSQNGQKFVKTDLKYTEKVQSCTDATNTGKSKCNVVQEAAPAPAIELLETMQCPGSGAWGHHASCQLVSKFTNDCVTVQAEMEARIAGEGGWVDPHNKGKYIKTGGTATILDVQRKTGNGKYTDKMTFTFENADSGCTLSGCSESQVFSIKDFGTNYCNLHDLYAGSQDGQKFVKTDLKSVETVQSCTDSSNSGSSKCNVAVAVHDVVV